MVWKLRSQTVNPAELMPANLERQETYRALNLDASSMYTTDLLNLKPHDTLICLVKLVFKWRGLPCSLWRGCAGFNIVYLKDYAFAAVGRPLSQQLCRMAVRQSKAYLCSA